MRGRRRRTCNEARLCIGTVGTLVVLKTLLLAGIVINSMPASANENMANSEAEIITSPDELGQSALLFKQQGRFSKAAQIKLGVDMSITGMINRVRLVQDFSNTTDQWQEGIYVFPLPENAAVDHMRMHINERVIEGQIKEKQAAKKIYEQAKQSGQRAALTEQERPNIFTTSVANIPPHGKITIEIEYQQLISYDAGVFSLRFPMVVGPRYIPGTQQVEGFSGSGWAVNTDQVPDAARVTPPVLTPDSQRKNPVSIHIDLDAGLELDKIDSRYHEIEIDKQSQRYQIRLKQGSTLANRDFVLTWQPHPNVAPRAAYFTENKDGEDYALIMMLPPETEQAATLAREIIYVIDTSGSMGGQSIKQARAALELALNQLRPGDRFNVIQFNSFTSKLFSQPQPVNQRTLKQALSYVHSLQANGGTEMASALRAAFANPPGSHYLRQVIFLTDGSIGNEQALFEIIREQLGQSRLFTIGIGSAPNSHFMQRAASFGRGTHTYIGKLNEVQERMQALFEKIESPVLKDIFVNWGPDNNIEMWPQKIGDLYRGEPVLITARSKTLPEQITIDGSIAGQQWSSKLKLTGGQNRAGVSTLWARNKIAALMQLKRDAEFASVKQTIIDTALQHHLVSQYTSLVAVDVTPVRPEEENMESHAIPTHLPEGWDYNKVFGQPYPATATDARVNFLIGMLLIMLFAFFYATRRYDSYV